MSERPCTEEELQKGEAIGVIRASRFVRRYARSHKNIDIDVILNIHKEIFKDIWPDIAGKLRDENIKIAHSSHLPVHFSEVSKLINILDNELKEFLEKLDISEGIILDAKNNSDEKMMEEIGKVVYLSAWIHHQITYIHPFREGNGRTARLVGNLILERYGLVGISIKMEKENKNGYCNALVQIDKMNDYEPLISLISDGLVDRYNGVVMKYYS
jgi:cell filamentation protein